MQSERILWIDVLKGYGMFLVILGHCFNKGTFIHNWVFSFHMPLFFFLSGLCFNYKKYPNCAYLLKTKVNALLIPYLKFFMLGTVVSLAIASWRADYSVSTFLIDVWTGYPSLTHITSIWFLLSLFMCFVIFWIILFVSEKVNMPWIKYLCISLSAAGGILISVVKSNVYERIEQDRVKMFLPGNRLPLTLDATMTALVFFAFGYFLKNVVKAFVESGYVLCISLAALISNIVCGCFLNERVNLHGCTLGNPILFYFAACYGIIFSIGICKLCSAHKSTVAQWLNSRLSQIGQNSICILGVQSLTIHIIVLLLQQHYDSDIVLYENLSVQGEIWSLAVVLFVSFIAMELNGKMPKNMRI